MRTSPPFDGNEFIKGVQSRPKLFLAMWRVFATDPCPWRRLTLQQKPTHEPNSRKPVLKTRDAGLMRARGIAHERGASARTALSQMCHSVMTLTRMEVSQGNRHRRFTQYTAPEVLQPNVLPTVEVVLISTANPAPSQPDLDLSVFGVTPSPSPSPPWLLPPPSSFLHHNPAPSLFHQQPVFPALTLLQQHPLERPQCHVGKNHLQVLCNPLVKLVTSFASCPFTKQYDQPLHYFS